MATTALHAQLLSELLEPRTLRRTESRYKFNPKPNEDNLLIPAVVPVPGLAANVSNQNLHLAAQRWL
ncbi:hypothetical protein SEA_ANON_68 [Gordonia phage Anon]|nr:hypothetical protein SEA_ANON_68 [Gordonia phage Anon]